MMHIREVGWSGNSIDGEKSVMSKTTTNNRVLQESSRVYSPYSKL